MVFINEKTFDIISSGEDWKCVEGYFQCDDSIVDIISLLNKKGYYTKFCCGSHPYPMNDIIGFANHTEEEVRYGIHAKNLDESAFTIRTVKVVTPDDKKRYKLIANNYQGMVDSYIEIIRNLKSRDLHFYISFDVDKIKNINFAVKELKNLPKDLYLEVEEKSFPPKYPAKQIILYRDREWSEKNIKNSIDNMKYCIDVYNAVLNLPDIN